MFNNQFSLFFLSNEFTLRSIDSKMICVPSIKLSKNFPQIYNKKMLKFGQKDITTKNFYGQRRLTDIFTIDINKVVISDKILCNNGQDYRYIVGY